ncbi:hypothetical protein [Undibacterium crateris]|uniref:hypothetical protein n=1 Tax=Undibacterium crateris TaxID=2528175 RepID=UPI0013895BA6|nr:hypothetical protein [Undibacterium crateris]NDI85069.1 hypothetical protein [Undibacterium crateris]
MMKAFVNYLPDQGYLRDKLADYRHEFETRYPGKSHSDFMAEVMVRRIQSSKAAYLRYGAYWWALKAALIEKGYDFSGVGEPIIEMVYTGLNESGLFDPDVTMVAAFEFATWYDATQFQGVREFDLFGDGEFWSLYDESMEFL